LCGIGKIERKIERKEEIIMLENINPSKIKELSLPERETLCEEIRSKIIDTVKNCGGHLSSNLGVVELTLGLFTVFDFPRDKVIWDVGHQCYPYKLLTDRFDRFDTLRKRGGISGFPKRAESEYDCYDTGHAGNSVSAAIGMAKAFALKGEKREIIAVLGDGSFNNGLIYEALNSLSSLGVKILIVLNDNGMSISPTVGKTHELFSEKKSEGKKKNIALLEQYGVKYMGGVNGNNLKEVTAALQSAKGLLQESTVLLHIRTVKGRGYDFCEENPTKTHGVAPFGSTPTREYSHIFGEKMLELAEKDPSVAVVSAAMTDALGLRPFFNRFPERAFDVGICEENASVLCSGMACGGMKPYYAIYSTFLQRAFDEIIHDVCAQDLPVTFCIDRGGLSGADGETHQGVFDLSYLSLVPGITIAVPKDGEEFAEMLEFSLGYDHPLAIRYPRAAKASFGKKRALAAGTFEYLAGDGKEKLTVLACGERAIAIALSVKEKTNVPFAVVNARFVKPLDKELLSAISSPYILTIEDNVRIGGFGSLIEDFYA
jgi:1-deoxy-D-xylulose-5-phosphate synthase